MNRAIAEKPRFRRQRWSAAAGPAGRGAGTITARQPPRGDDLPGFGDAWLNQGIGLFCTPRFAEGLLPLIYQLDFHSVFRLRHGSFNAHDAFGCRAAGLREDRFILLCII
jgi:hypothetical protein